jgi:hypothetical protein
MDPLDVWRSATPLIRTLGFDGAAFEASYRTRDIRIKGDLEGERIWIQIGAKIKELKSNGWYVVQDRKHIS